VSRYQKGKTNLDFTEARDSEWQWKALCCLKHAFWTAQIKIDKYSKLVSTHIFYPFVIQTAGTWHEMAIELTQEIGRRITTITEDTRETTFLFQRFSMALQRGNAVSFHNTMVTV